MKTRIEVNENGEFYIKIPDEVVEKFRLEEDDLMEWDDNDDDFVILSFA